jgi:septum formation protein
VRPSDVEELAAGDPEWVATENARRKARAVAGVVDPRRPVLGVDTVVVLDGRLYGKARDAGEARSYLETLSGRAHDVWSAIALLRDGREQIGATRTTVTFRKLDERTLDWYVKSAEWRGRAGAYAIQGKGSALVDRIDGDYWNVVGLPVAKLLDMAPELLG